MTVSLQQRQRQMPNPVMPWWRVGTMWFAVVSLAAVVVGSIAMAAVAIGGADRVVTEAPQRLEPGETPGPQTPAMLARNHAAAATAAVVSGAAPEQRR